MRVEPAVPSIYRNKSPHFTTCATSLQWKPAAAHSARIATRFTAVPRAKFAERIMFKLRPTKINLSRAVFPTSLVICLQKDAEQLAFRWLNSALNTSFRCHEARVETRLCHPRFSWLAPLARPVPGRIRS